MTDVCDLTARKCKPCEGGVPPLTEEEANNLLQQLGQDWQLMDNKISRTLSFKNYYQTMAFVNAVAWISHQEDHHPDMLVGYNQCRVEYTTHAIGGLSENDFICAAKVDMLLGS
ncbi:putative pterin-4-alpha-carbinolamine dehydratase [Nitrosomonas stercoris]|uniref:Putative pterin-4-alpha-carbinolamine dehydratase n=1 Tax=Nitrosomonas stercoris TaxID=1444684 RepID=A0A4Y1YM24_9PROT|nr:putative pterin-4-alpha-carbinolamine dehydratase [Nitrosomonas stercoris]